MISRTSPTPSSPSSPSPASRLQSGASHGSCLLSQALRRSAQWAHLRWTRMLLGRGAGYPLLRGGCGFRPVRGYRNHMNDLVAAAFELVENFGQREDGAGVNVVQQQDAPAARLDTADGASRNLAIVDAGPVVRQEICAPSHIAMGREVLLDRLLAQQTRYPKERRHRLRVPDGLAQRLKTLFDLA